MTSGHKTKKSRSQKSNRKKGDYPNDLSCKRQVCNKCKCVVNVCLNWPCGVDHDHTVPCPSSFSYSSSIATIAIALVNLYTLLAWTQKCVLVRGFFKREKVQSIPNKTDSLEEVLGFQKYVVRIILCMCVCGQAEQLKEETEWVYVSRRDQLHTVKDRVFK